MILQIASLLIRRDQVPLFEAAFEKAERLLHGINGYVSHELQRSVERDDHYVLLVEWRSLEDHTLGFTKSAEFVRWHELLSGFVAELPNVEHFRPVALRRDRQSLRD
ncbi:MAG TPA: antibiotic biosynthesis monooxygenase [Burkholderiaceae bacterium]|nr:antibiotic biosynthesis monooxygenase [Burkholderiaceae bacterium]